MLCLTNIYLSWFGRCVLTTDKSSVSILSSINLKNLGMYMTNDNYVFPLFISRVGYFIPAISRNGNYMSWKFNQQFWRRFNVLDFGIVLLLFFFNFVFDACCNVDILIDHYIVSRIIISNPILIDISMNIFYLVLLNYYHLYRYKLISFINHDHFGIIHFAYISTWIWF